MKVLFIMKYPLVDQYSIMQKLNGQINAVRNLGHEPYYISFDREYMYLDNGKEREIIQKTPLGHVPNYFHTFVFYDIYRAVKKVIEENNFDIVYFRHSPLNVSGYQMIKSIEKKSKLVVEITSFPPYTEKAKNVLRAFYHMLSKKWWERSAKYVTLFTGIGEHADEYLGRPFMNIDNGIDISFIPPRAESKNNDGKIHILAVASMCEWHGYERIIQGLAEWKNEKSKEYIIDLVGDEGDGSLEKWKKLAIELGVSEQVVFHGRMTGDALTGMYNMASIGICSLALYKIGFNTGSVLKLREYMARGLPFVYAHDDPHMSEDMPWCIRISNNEEPVRMDDIDLFVNRIAEIKDISNQMREYARIHMTWEAQFEKVFSKLSTDSSNKTIKIC